MKFRITVLITALALSACVGKSSSSGDASKQTKVTTQQEQVQNWLNEHNKYRKMHQVSELKWSAKIAKSAQDYANTCPNGHSNTNYGENLAYSTALQTENDVVKRWYDEVDKYDFSNPKFNTQTGHFTQIVWKNTTEIGCGQKSNCGGKWKDIVVCQYNPAGNYQRQFGANVFPKK